MVSKSSQDELFLLREQVKQLSKQLKLPETKVLQESLKPENIRIPVTLFSDRSKGVLEILVQYLKDQENMTYHQIAVLLNRNDRTIWTAYKQAQKKNGKPTAK